MFATDKIGETMTVAMTPANGKAWFGVGAARPVGRGAHSRPRLALQLPARLLPRREVRRPAGTTSCSRTSDAARAVGAVGHQQARRRPNTRITRRRRPPRSPSRACRLSSRCKDTSTRCCSVAPDVPGTMTPRRVRDVRRRPRQLHGLHGRAGREQAHPPRHRRAAVPRRAVRLRVLAEARVLERRPLDSGSQHGALRGASASRSAMSDLCNDASRRAPPASRASDAASQREEIRHDDALFRHDRSLQPALPHRAAREGHGLPDHRRRPRPQARGSRGDESVQPGAGARRARPRAARVEHHQRVHRRALPASAADAGRPGDARARAAVPAPVREGALRRTSTRSRAATRSSSTRRAASCATR